MERIKERDLSPTNFNRNPTGSTPALTAYEFANLLASSLNYACPPSSECHHITRMLHSSRYSVHAFVDQYEHFYSSVTDSDGLKDSRKQNPESSEHITRTPFQQPPAHGQAPTQVSGIQEDINPHVYNRMLAQIYTDLDTCLSPSRRRSKQTLEIQVDQSRQTSPLHDHSLTNSSSSQYVPMIFSEPITPPTVTPQSYAQHHPRHNLHAENQHSCLQSHFAVSTSQSTPSLFPPSSQSHLMTSFASPPITDGGLAPPLSFLH